MSPTEGSVDIPSLLMSEARQARALRCGFPRDIELAMLQMPIASWPACKAPTEALMANALARPWQPAMLARWALCCTSRCARYGLLKPRVQ